MKNYKLVDLIEEESDYKKESGKIYRAFHDQNKGICLVSSDEYVPFASLVIQSLIQNSTASTKYDIVILTSDMTIINMKLLSDMVAGFENISLRFFDVNCLIEKYDFYVWAHFTKNTYFRLLIPEIFEDYEKVLYFDSDIIINHDITPLLNLEFGDYLMAAALDTHVVSYCHMSDDHPQLVYNRQILKLEKPDHYFQMGVCIYNCKAIRSEFGGMFLIEQASKMQLKWLDQDLINLHFKNRIYKLNNKWNVMIANNFPYSDEYYLPKELRREYVESRINPNVIHYVGGAIPCYTVKPDMYVFFWKYARNSPFYEILLQKMSCAIYSQPLAMEDFVEIIKGVFNYRKNRFRYIVMKVLSSITFGGFKKKCMKKRFELREKILVARKLKM